MEKIGPMAYKIALPDTLEMWMIFSTKKSFGQ